MPTSRHKPGAPGGCLRRGPGRPVAAGHAARKRMRGFVPFKSCPGDGASSAAQQVQSIHKGADRKSPVAGHDCARIAVGTHTAGGGRRTLVELDRHHRMIDRRGPHVNQGGLRFGRRVSGNGRDISGDREVQSAAFGRFVVRAGKAVVRSLSRRTVARAGKIRTASDRHKQVVARWNKMSVASAMVMAPFVAGSSEKDCNA